MRLTGGEITHESTWEKSVTCCVGWLIEGSFDVSVRGYLIARVIMRKSVLNDAQTSLFSLHLVYM